MEVSAHDRVISLGDLIDRGPNSFQAKAWIEGINPATRFDLVLRGNHEQMMLEALAESLRPQAPYRRNTAWKLWRMNGGNWWRPQGPGGDAEDWVRLLGSLPFAARSRPGMDRSAWCMPVDGNAYDLTRTQALWSRVRHGYLQREIGETGDEHLGPVEGVRAVLTGHTPSQEPRCDRPGFGRLTIARVDGKEIETWSFDRSRSLPVPSVIRTGQPSLARLPHRAWR